MKITNKSGLPAGLVRAIELDPYSNEGSDVTASTLANPPLLEALKRRHESELEEDASERVWALLGQAMHVIADRGAGKTEGVESETRLSMEVLGWKLSGAFDHMDIESGVLSDYKCTSAWTLVYGDRLKDWEKQLNVLAHLWNHATGKEAERIEVVAILRDWSERDKERVKDYPQASAVVVPLELWSQEKRQAYIEDRVKKHQKAREGILIPCTDEERWAKRDKKTGKTVYSRCERYCQVRAFCPVLADEREELQLTAEGAK